MCGEGGRYRVRLCGRQNARSARFFLIVISVRMRFGSSISKMRRGVGSNGLYSILLVRQYHVRRRSARDDDCQQLGEYMICDRQFSPTFQPSNLSPL